MTKVISESIERICESPCKDLAWAFFAFYSRFEYALKRTPRYLLCGDAAKAEAGWGKFAKYCDQKEGAVEQLQQTDAWRYLNSSPPRKQKCDASGLVWSEPIWKKEEELPFKWVCDCLRVVRNNFFHGGKFPMTPISEPTRNSDLLYHGILLLQFLADQDVSVREFVYETDLG